MKIGIILYSHTGNTKRVGEKAAERLRLDGHSVTFIPLQIKNPIDFKAEEIEVVEIPDISQFEGLLLGSPIHGGRMSGPLRYFLNQITTFDNLPVAVLVTHFFRSEWGAIQTIRDIRLICEEKYGKFVGSADVKWFSLIRKRLIAQAVDQISQLFLKYL